MIKPVTNALIKSIDLMVLTIDELPDDTNLSDAEVVELKLLKDEARTFQQKLITLRDRHTKLEEV